MNKWLAFTALTALAFSCDSPDVPNYNMDIKTDRKEYKVGDSVLVTIQNDMDQQVYVSVAIEASDSNAADYKLQQKSVNNWKTIAENHPVPTGKVYSLQPGNRLFYKLALPPVPENGVNIFRIDHRIFMNQDRTKPIGSQQTVSNSFFVYE